MSGRRICAAVIEGSYNFGFAEELGIEEGGGGGWEREDGRADSIKDTQCPFSHVQSDSIWPDS